MQQLNAAELARARQHTYELLSRLLREGVSAETRPLLHTIPPLAAALPADRDPDHAAAAHYDLFHFNLFANEALFRDTTGLVGGERSEAVGAFYRRAGFPPGDDPDHISRELAFLAFLCAAEADARADQVAQCETEAAILAERFAPVLQRLDHLQSDFLTAHLLVWLPALVVALRRQGQPFYAALADLTWDVVADHAAASAAAASAAAASAAAASAAAAPWPAPPDLLTSDKTSLKDIARYLTTPPFSGLWLGRHAITQLARRQTLPRGFGGRVQMLLNLLRAAVQYDGAATLLAHLHDEAAQWHADYAALAAAAPALAPFVAPWQARAAATGELLQAMRATLLALDGGDVS